MHVGLVIGALLSFLLSVFLWCMGPLSSFRTWIDWFNQNDPKKLYRCLPPQLMAYYYSPPFLFGGAKLFFRHGAVESDWNVDFLMTVLRSFGYGVAKSQDAVLVPRNLCKSLAPDDGDPPQALAARDAVNVPHNSSVVVNGKTRILTNGLKGAWPQNEEDWRTFMCLPAEFGGWGCNFDGDQWKGNSGTWTTAKSNFLWRFYSIPYDSELIQGFIVDSVHWAGKNYLPGALLSLLGAEPNSLYGGWYGFLVNGDRWGDYNSFEVQRFVWANALNPQTSATRPCSSPAGYIGSGLGMGMTAAMLAPMFLGPAGGEVVWTAGLIAKTTGAAIAGAALGGVVGAAAQGCF